MMSTTFNILASVLRVIASAFRRDAYLAAAVCLLLGSGQVAAQTALPDLKITAMSVSGIGYNSNGSWTINGSYTVTNVGTVAVTSGWADMGYLSANGVLDNSSQSGTYYLHYGSSLAPGASYTVPVSFTTSTATPSGNYSFFIKADGHSPSVTGGTITDNGFVLEADETNNTASVAVSLARPDLKLSSMSVTGITYNSDGSWTISGSYTVTNVGTVPVTSGWADMGYLSANGVLDNSSQSGTYYLYYGSSLAPGASYTVPVSFTTSTATPSGNYSFFIKADGHSPSVTGGTITDNGSLVEADETNNTASVAVSLARPDLKLSSMSVTGTTYNSDGSWTINGSYTVTNVGTVPVTSGWADMGYLSANGVLDNSSQSGTYYLHYASSLAPGASYAVPVSFTTSATTPAGNYSFFIKTDGHSPSVTGGTITDNGSLVEADETNNTASVAVVLARPDLVLSAMTVGSVVPVSGVYQIPVTYTVTNASAVPITTRFVDMGYLSANGVLDNASQSNNYFLHDDSNLAAGASYTYSVIFTSLASMTPGNYTFFLKTDGHNPGYNGAGATNSDGGSLVETNETNNVLSKAVYLPITTTTTMTTSVNPVKAGQGTTLTATVTPAAATGTVSFYEYYNYGTILIGKAPLNAGTASFSAMFTTAGSKAQPLIAVYSGDSLYYTSTSPQVGQTINSGVGTPTLTTSAPTIVSGRPLTLTATLPAAATGTVTFLDGSVSLGVVAAASGQAVLTTSSLTTSGVHVLTASYIGDANFASGVSSAVNETVAAIVKASTTTSLQAAPAFVVTGGSVDVTIAVTGSIPAGNVAIFDGASTTLATIPVVAGQASTSIPLSTTGSHTLSAHYLGDNYNNASVSSGVSIEVNETSTSSPGAMTWIYGYDASGNRWIDIDPNGHETDRNFDQLDRPFQILSPFFSGTSGSRATVGINYDGQDRVSSVLDPRSLTTSYTLDGLSNPLSLTSPDTGAASATFDQNGNMLTRTDSRGQKTTYSYDALGRLTSANYASGTATVYQYDGGPTPAPNSIGRLTLITDESGSTAYTYDFRGNVFTKVQTIAVTGQTLTTSYTWGNSGSSAAALTSMTYPSGSRVNYAYDTYGRVTSVTLNPTNANGVSTNTGTTINLLSGITYNGAGAVTGWTWSDGVPYTRTFDSFGRLSSYLLGNPAGTGISAGLTRAIGYDSAAQILAYTHTNSAGAQAAFDQHFTYDPLGRLITNSQSTTSYGYTYDASGNRTSSAIGSTTYTDVIPSSSNRLSSAQTATGTQTFSDDAAGNTLTDGVATYTYSPRGRMATAKVGLSTVSYLYNGLDQRVVKTGSPILVPTSVAYYDYDEKGQLVGEYGSGLASVYETVYLGSLPISVLKQSGSPSSSTLVTTPYNVYADQTNTPRVVTRSTDEGIVWRWDSAEAFGATGPNTNPSGLGVFTYNQRFPGQVLDVETGNYYNWHRDYNPALGRYTESDPVGLGGGINTYAYVDADPLSYLDPLGLTQQDINVAVSVTKSHYPDLNMGTGPPIPDLPANGGEAAHSNLINQGNQTNIPGRDGRIHLNENYLKCLSDAEALDLLDTIIHESEHFTRPASRQVPPDYDHTFIVPDTARRVQKIKSDYMKALAKARKGSKCDCPK